ncbi:MAG: sec-independent protein translocase protein TatC [Acidimicrobiales bacterium]
MGFEFPIVLIFLQLIGLVDNEMLRSGRRFALVGIVALVAVLTPSGDPYTLMVLSVPMYLFYEISIAFGWWRSRKKAKKKTSQEEVTHG